MENLLQLLIALDEGGCVRITSNGTTIVAYLDVPVIPRDIRDGILQFKSELLRQLKRPCQYPKNNILAKGVWTT